MECRVSQVKQKGISALLYKDARCDMRILDETVGPGNWQREHYECKGNLFCRVGINITQDHNNPFWVWKSDCGSESYTEKEKGEASDSFKRACFNWGIGRELYTAPFIWISADSYKTIESNGKQVPNVKLKVTYMAVENGKITALQIYEEKGKCIVFERGRCPKEGEAAPPLEAAAVPCTRCGKEIQDGKKRDGSLWISEDIVKYSTKMFNHPLCPACMRVEKEEEKKAMSSYESSL